MTACAVDHSKEDWTDVHGLMGNTDDIDEISVDHAKDYVTALGKTPVAGMNIGPVAAQHRALCQPRKARDQGTQVRFELLIAPFFNGEVSYGIKIFERSRRQPPRMAHTRALARAITS